MSASYTTTALDLDRTGSFIGYDDREDADARVTGDAYLAQVDAFLTQIQQEELNDHGADIGADDDSDLAVATMQRTMAARAERIARLQAAEKALDRKVQQERAPRRKQRLISRRDKAARLQRQFTGMQELKANQRQSRLGVKSKSTPSMSTDKAGYANALAKGKMMPKAGVSDDDLTSIMLHVPYEGELVVVPLLSGGVDQWLHTLAIATVANAANVTVTSAAITYASLRVLGLVGKFSAVFTATQGLLHYEVTSAIVSGDIEMLYGSQLFGMVPTTTTTAQGRVFVPSLRDNSYLEKNSTIRVITRAQSHAAHTKAITVWAQMAAICERVSDPKAERY